MIMLYKFKLANDSKIKDEWKNYSTDEKNKVSKYLLSGASKIYKDKPDIDNHVYYVVMSMLNKIPFMTSTKNLLR